MPAYSPAKIASSLSPALSARPRYIPGVLNANTVLPSGAATITPPSPPTR